MTNKRNSWIKRSLNKFNKRMIKTGETIGAPIRKPIEKYFNLNKKAREIMRNKGLASSIMGSTNYTTAYKKIRKFLKNNDNSSATSYAESQSSKINK